MLATQAKEAAVHPRYIFRERYNYGPRDPRYLECTDEDIILDLLTHMEHQKLKHKEEAADWMKDEATREAVMDAVTNAAAKRGVTPKPIAAPFRFVAE